jgi:lysophospholipase L1-like esterase
MSVYIKSPGGVSRAYVSNSLETVDCLFSHPLNTTTIPTDIIVNAPSATVTATTSGLNFLKASFSSSGVLLQNHISFSKLQYCQGKDYRVNFKTNLITAGGGGGESIILQFRPVNGWFNRGLAMVCQVGGAALGSFEIYYIDAAGGLSGSSLYIGNSSGVALWAVGDELYCEMSVKNYFTFTWNVFNLTRGTKSYYTHDYNLVNSTDINPTIFQPAIGVNKANNILFREINVSARVKKSPDYMILGDSITLGQGSTGENLNDGWAHTIRTTSTKNIAVLAAGGNHIKNLHDSLSVDIDLLAPKDGAKVVLMIGTNNYGKSDTLATMQYLYTNLINSIVERGLVPIICFVTPRNSVDVSPLNTWLSTTYSGTYTVIDTYTPLKAAAGTGIHATYDSGDALHPNAAGQALIRTTVTAAVPDIL